MSKKTTITFDQAGNMKVDQTGFTGKACAEATDKLLAGIKRAKATETQKPEMNMLGNASAGQSLSQRW